MNASAPALTLLVPCFNEAARVEALVAAVRSWHEAHPSVLLEVMCVDDGSRDDTGIHLEAARGELSVLRVCSLPENVGKGAALRAGMAQARGDIVLFLDADLAVDLSHVDAALALMAEGADVVVGCRNVAGAAVMRRQGLLRRTLGRGYRALALRMLGLRVSDVTCGFKAFRREVGQAVFAETGCPGWGIDAEVLFLAQRRGCVVRELPVQWFHGEASAVRMGRDVFGALLELTSVRVRHGWGGAPTAQGTSAGAEPIPAPSPPEA